MAIKFQGFTGGGGAATGGLTYKGTFNATAGTPDISNALQGDLYVIDVAGTIYGQTWAINDHLLVNADMGGSVTNSKIDKVDNTSDTALQIGSNLSDLGNLATAQTNLNLKTAAYEDVGTTANKIVQLDGTAKLPAVDGSQLTNLPSALVSSVNTATGAVNIYADDSTLNIDGTALTLSGTGATSTLNVDVGTTANKIVQLDGTAKLPAVDGSALTNLPSAPVTSVNTATGAVNIYADDTTLNIDGTALTLSGTGATSTLNVDVGTIANKIVQLDGTAKLPAVDGSQLTNLPSAPVTSVNGATGAVYIYADDTTLNIDGTALVLSGTGATSTLNVDVGTTANKIIQLDGAAKIPAVDGSQLTDLSFTGLDVSTVTGAAINANINQAHWITTLGATSVTLTLPLSSGIVDGDTVVVTRIRAGELVIVQHGSDVGTLVNYATTIAASVTIQNNYQMLTIRWNGSAWYIFDQATGTAANLDVGTSANQVVQLDGTAKLPAVDGSALTNLPSAPVTSVNTATGAVNIYADDTTLNIDGTALTLSGTGATSTLNVDVGTTANKIVQLDGTAKLPAVDGSQLTNLPSSGGGWTYAAITSASSPVASAVAYHYGADSSSGVITFNLPALSGLSGGEQIRVKLNTAGNNLNVTANGADTIDGSGTAYALSIALSSITLVASSGTNWEIV